MSLLDIWNWIINSPLIGTVLLIYVVVMVVLVAFGVVLGAFTIQVERFKAWRKR